MGDAHEKSVLLERVRVIRAELRDALGEAAVISIKRWLPGVSKKDDQLDPTDAYHKSMFGGDYKPKHVKTAEYCRQSAFKQAHSMISVFERRNTLEDLARKSKASLHSMYSDDDGGRKRTMSDADRRHKTLTELGNLQSLSNLLAATSPKSQKKEKFSFEDEDNAPSGIPKIIRQLSGHNPSGADHFGQTGAGGAGALPASSDIINIVNTHFNEESVDVQHKKREASHMSYIYGDEESQHHKLPEYSQDHGSQMVNAQHFEPKMPDLAEDEEDGSHRHENSQSTTYKTESHTKHTVIDISMDQHQFDANALDEAPKTKSPKNKMVIKIYPPSLEAVASKSPTGGDNEKYFD